MVNDTQPFKSFMNQVSRKLRRAHVRFKEVRDILPRQCNLFKPKTQLLHNVFASFQPINKSCNQPYCESYKSSSLQTQLRKYNGHLMATAFCTNNIHVPY